MNSEELELSLRSEFENYLKSVVAEMRKESTEFQSRIEAEFDRHKSQFDEAFQSFNARFDSEHQFDEGFKSLVAEHLNLARDAGSKLAADAMAEAEKLAPVAVAAEPTVVEVEVNKFDGLRDAINDISSKDSQSNILKALVQHAAAYAPRGAFFIIKSDNFVGWKVFGSDDEALENAVREIHFPTASNSILGEAVRSLTTVESRAGAYADDSIFLGPLSYGNPDHMYAIPLTARGRGVAVLYADAEGENAEINREALEVLVRVAGMTVEMRASAAPAPKVEESTTQEVGAFAPSPEQTTSTETPAEETGSFAFSESVSYEGGFPAEAYVETPEPEPEPVAEFVSEPEVESVPEYQAEAEVETAPAFETQFAQETPAFEPPRFDEAPAYQTEAVEASPFAEAVEEPQAVQTETAAFEYETFGSSPEPAPEPFRASEPSDFSSGGSIESASFQSKSPFDTSSDQFAPAVMPTGGMEPAVEAVIEAPIVAPAMPQARLSDRNVDLPIEVSEDERRSHNDARRFARLLVSEIKLYNEKKVTEGRDANDLYERLREAIDRSREMYDKRVQPPVAAKFDYFHYELVNSLADGEANRLGNGYPGATI